MSIVNRNERFLLAFFRAHLSTTECGILLNQPSTNILQMKTKIATSVEHVALSSCTNSPFVCIPGKNWTITYVK